MEWNKQAADEFIRLPMSRGDKQSTKVFAEKLARKSRRNRVTLNELKAAIRVTCGNVPEEKLRLELEKRIAGGETDLRQRMEQEGREILARETDLFKIDICPGQSSNCRNLIVELVGLKKEMEQKLRELEVSEIVADLHRDDEKIMAHHRITVSISGCPVGCTGPEARPFGVHGVSRPAVTDVTCSECYACVDSCLRGAIVIRDGVPHINTDRCDLCEFCVKACPTGTLVSEKKGYRIMVGGRFGRFHQLGTQLFKIADRDALMAALEASVRTIKEEAAGYEDLATVTNRVGVAPIFQRLYQENGK